MDYGIGLSEGLMAVKCPQCGSKRVWKDGLRYLADGKVVQRYLCRDCGYRFSHGVPSNKPYKPQYTHGYHGARREANLMTEVLRRLEKREAGATETSQQEVKGKIIEFLWHLRKHGLREFSIRDYSQKLNYIAKKTDILNPEAVEDFLAKASMSETSKHHYVAVLKSFYDYLGIKWEPPTYRVVTKIPFIPTEAELDILIANTSKTVSALLQLLKETGMRLGEALNLKWSDIDFEHKTVRITPEKGSLPRILPISDKAIAMIKRLPKKSEKIFPSRDAVQTVFYRRRKQLAFKLNNPRLLQISFHTFRHWKGTMEYHKTKDILHVKELLGHKNIQNTLIYITIDKAIFQNTTEEFHVKTAKTVEEACKLIEVGFEYVCEINGVKIFRKRK